MNPQTGEILAPREPADLRQQPVRARHQQRRLREARSTNPDKPLHEPRGPGALPARARPTSSWPGRARWRTRRSRRPRPRSRRRGYLTLGGDAVLRLEPPRLRRRATSTAASATRATRSSSRWRASSASTAWRTGPSSTASGTPTGIDLPGEVSGIVPTNEWKQATLGAPIFAGETYQAGIGQGYDVVTPIQLINAYAALANGGTLYQPQIVRDIVGPGRHGRPPVQAEDHPQDEGAAERPADHAQCGPQHGRSCATPTTWSTCRSRSPASPVRPSSGPATARAGCRSTRGSSGFVPEGPVPRLVQQDRLAARSSSPSPTTRGRRATSRPRS